MAGFDLGKYKGLIPGYQLYQASNYALAQSRAEPRFRDAKFSAVLLIDAAYLESMKLFLYAIPAFGAYEALAQTL